MTELGELAGYLWSEREVPIQAPVPQSPATLSNCRSALPEVPQIGLLLLCRGERGYLGILFTALSRGGNEMLCPGPVFCENE